MIKHFFSISFSFLFLIVFFNVAHAQDLTDFVPDDDVVSGQNFTIDATNQAGPGDIIQLEFGDSLGEYLQFDIDDDRFELSNDLSLEGSELEDFRVENAASDPTTCTGGVEGRLYFNTGSNELQICDGSSWGGISGSGGVDQTNVVYVDGTRAAETGEVYNTLASAVSYINTQSPGSGNPWVILMEPGTNAESVTIPTFTVLVGRDRESTTMTGTITLAANAAVQNVTIGSGGELDIGSGNTGYVTASDVNIDDGASGGIDGTLVISESFVDGTIGATGVVQVYESTVGPTSLTNNGSIGTYHSTVLNITNNSIWNNFATAYDNSVLSADDQLDATNTQEAIDELVLGTPADNFVIDENQGLADDVAIQFGSIVGESLRWDEGDDAFVFSNDLSIEGSVFTLDSDESGNPDQDVDIVANQGSENSGILRYDDGNNRWEFSNDGSTFSPLSTGFSARKQGFITLPAGTTGTISVTGVGFQANFVEFTLNNDIESVNFDQVSPTNNSSEQGSFGWGKGYAYDTGSGLEQQVQFFSASSNSINAHRGYSSNSNSVFVVASDQNGNNLGRIVGTVSSFNSNGFDLNITTSTLSAPYVIMYSAQVMSGTEIVFQDEGTNETTFTIDQDNVGAGTNVSIVANQGSDLDGTLRYNATTNQWELSNNGGAFQPIAAGSIDAATLDGVDSSQFLRSDGSDAFTSGTLTLNGGTALQNNGTVNGSGSFDFSGSTQVRMRQGSADPGTCLVGEEFYNTTSNQAKVCSATNTWSILRRDFFGTAYQYAESDAVSITTSATFQQKLRLTTSSLAAGTYRIGWSYQWNHDSTSNGFEGRVQIDDSTEVMFHQQEPQDSAGTFGSTGSDQQHQLSGFKHISLSSGVHTIDIDYRTNSAGNESSIWNTRIELWRVQ